MTGPTAHAPIDDVATRDAQLRIAQRATDLARDVRAFMRVPMPRDVATGEPLLTDSTESDVADALLGAELALHSLTGVILCNLGISPTGGIGNGPGHPAHVPTSPNPNGTQPRISDPR